MAFEFSVDAEVQRIVDSNASEIAGDLFPSFLDRAFKDDAEFSEHPHFRVFTHFTNLKMLCLRTAPAECGQVTLLAKRSKHKLVVKTGEELVQVGSEIYSAPFDLEIVAFNHRLETEPSLVVRAPQGAGYLLFANRKFQKKRKNLDS